MDRYICIHGHFYQPPRENAWLEAIEVQDSAYPYHDWNERITAECYAPNAWSRVLDHEGQIAGIVNNYSRISFNFGPTLLSWMAPNEPEVYQAIMEADRVSQERFTGHGSALAQAYNHLIMPLANHRDQRTQVIWGIRDFEHRFGRRPEGMWLPEAAANIDSLEALAEQGIKFTVLAPMQARRVRPLQGGRWHDVSGERIDPTRAYLQRLPSGRSIAIFFYDGPISKAVAFEGLLNNGEVFAGRLQSGMSDSRDRPQLVHIATDGESYGHHHRHGDMALASAIRHIEERDQARLTIYGEYLEMHPPTHEVEIFENSSWSCVHGVERWRSNCGCNTGVQQGWNQEWRGPLRAALDWLRDATAPRYETEAARYLRDPWVARDEYISVVLDRSPENLSRFLEKHSHRLLDKEETIHVLKLLELQRQSMLMYTSCGWFFDELSRIETVQVIQYAGRVIQLAEEVFGDSLEPEFVHLLSKARSNLPQHGDGGAIYEKWVRPARLGLLEVGAHYAVSSLFEEPEDVSRVYAFEVRSMERGASDLGRARLVSGRARIESVITTESVDIGYGALFPGDHNVSAGVRSYVGPEAFDEFEQEVNAAFNAADFPEVIRAFDRHFDASTYSIRSLFRDAQRRVLDSILDSTLEGAEAVYSTIYEREAPIMHFLAAMDSPVPKAFRIAAEFFIDTNLRRVIGTNGDLDPARVRALVEEAQAIKVELDTEGLGYQLTATIHRLMDKFAADPFQIESLRELSAAVALAHEAPVNVDLWEVQKLFYDLARTVYPAVRDASGSGSRVNAEWIEEFVGLGRDLSVRVG
ncbi:MAG: DUF3536 domain-containing protein [Dehalococcoidia bacterium]